jgi:cobalt-precorrin-5B (C1)-methyltransferase
MWPESSEAPKKLRSGLTTGCCATACCVAAAQGLLMNLFGKVPSHSITDVSVELPKGKIVTLKICDSTITHNNATAATIKDAGDDPDVTHGARVFVELSLIQEKEITFHAAKGVGIVTREGLSLAVGQAAINPVPRKMMTQHLLQVAQEFSYDGGFKVAVGIENGEALALKTMNPRLGIVGGLSVLGTTGIVRPFSCSAYIASIHQGIDVAKANGVDHIAATTGNSSETAIRDVYQLSDMALIEMGDFVGAVLKYLKKVQIKKLSICGGFGKLSKLADGHLDLHSGASKINFEHLADLAKNAGANPQLLKKILLSNTSIEALKHCQLEKIDLAILVCEKALMVARRIVPISVELEVWAVNRKGEIVANACERRSVVNSQ